LWLITDSKTLEARIRRRQSIGILTRNDHMTVPEIALHIIGQRGLERYQEHAQSQRHPQYQPQARASLSPVVDPAESDERNKSKTEHGIEPYPIRIQIVDPEQAGCGGEQQP
jgi:hypothetical protein